MWSHKQLVTLCTIPCKSSASVTALPSLIPLARVGGNGFMWTSHVLPRDARLPRDGRLADCSGGEYDFLRVFPFQQFSAVCWSGDGGLQASLPSCPAKPPERIGGYDDNKLLDWSSCTNIPRGTWSLHRWLASYSRANEGLVSQSLRCQLS